MTTYLMTGYALGFLTCLGFAIILAGFFLASFTAFIVGSVIIVVATGMTAYLEMRTKHLL